MKVTTTALKGGAGLLVTYIDESGWDSRVRLNPGQAYRGMSYGDLAHPGGTFEVVVDDEGGWSLPPPPPPPPPPKPETVEEPAAAPKEPVNGNGQGSDQ